MIRFFSRDRTRERGIALIAAIALAVLYFGLMQLMLIDAGRALTEAQRFRARVVSFTLAENAAEMAAVHLMSRYASRVTASDAQGDMIGSMRRSQIPGGGGGTTTFEIEGEGEAGGVVKHKTKVSLQGRVDGGRITIDYSTHVQ